MPRGYSEKSTLNPAQQQGFEQLMQQLLPLLQKSSQYYGDILDGSDEGFQRFSAPYERQFREQIIPGLAEQFAGTGSLSSSGFQNALGSAGAGLSENLASLRESLRSQIPGQILSNLQNLLQLNTKAYLPKQPGFLQSLGLGAAGGIGQGLGHLVNPFSWR